MLARCSPVNINKPLLRSLHQVSHWNSLGQWAQQLPATLAHLQILIMQSARCDNRCLLDPRYIKQVRICQKCRISPSIAWQGLSVHSILSYIAMVVALKLPRGLKVLFCKREFNMVYRSTMASHGNRLAIPLAGFTTLLSRCIAANGRTFKVHSRHSRKINMQRISFDHRVNSKTQGCMESYPITQARRSQDEGDNVGKTRNVI